MLNRTIKISTIALSIICACVVLCTGVFAATRQSTTITTSVQFTPGILAKVEVSVNGDPYTTVFDNTSGTNASQGHFVINGEADETLASVPIKFKVTNLTPNNNSKKTSITSTLSLETTNGVYLELDDAIVDSITVGTDISYNIYAESEEFHIVSLYQNLPITVIFAIESTETAL